MNHIGTGKIIYDPYRPGLKKNNKGWCIVTVDPEITRYYRWWIVNRFHIKELKQPSWDAHISIIRGEKDIVSDNVKHLWKKYHKKIVQFEYSHYPVVAYNKKGPGTYWYINVYSEELLNIRRELNRPADWKLHITVGRTWY